MNGLSDVRLKLHATELQDAQRPQLTDAPEGMSRWQVMLRRWHTRRQLLALSADQLRDIGLTADEAREEGLKPFWRD